MSILFSASMVGDVNLFLNELEDRTCGELEIMIAGSLVLPNLIIIVA